jgi:hypothetical protein
MAGTIRKRTWVTRRGETKTAWLADYFDQNRHRHTKQFATKRAADAWLLQTRGEVRDGVHTPDSDHADILVEELWAALTAEYGPRPHDLVQKITGNPSVAI